MVPRSLKNKEFFVKFIFKHSLPFDGEVLSRSLLVKLYIYRCRCTSTLAHTLLSPWRKKLKLNEKFGTLTSEWSFIGKTNHLFNRAKPFDNKYLIKRKINLVYFHLNSYFSIILCNALNNIDRQSYDKAFSLHEPFAWWIAEEKKIKLKTFSLHLTS